ncbi:uncharacterized protein [Clytia hemisphaerica]|uniref:uncharacterized protein n=1 Tax=Clytia hemisphaerica TaxID=252671 RepID=UPI0034D55543
MQYSKILAISFLVTILLCGTDAFETKESRERNNKLYQTLANAQPKHATTKDSIHSSTQKKNIQKTKILESGLYNVLANIKEGKMKRRNMTSLSARHAMIRPTEPPTRGTRPTRPTRPTPPTRPTRATNCPCNQNCQSCGCTCHKKQIKQNIHARKTMPGSRKTITTPRNLTEIFRKKLLKSRNETDSRKRDFMNEVLDSSVFSTGHAPSQWQDFYDNGAKWDQYEAPQVHHDRKINFEDPNYKVSLGFTDGGHELMEHANEMTNNHVEAYPGEIVSGENYLSKFVSPVEQDTRRPCSRGRRNYGYDKKRYRIKGEGYDPCSREMTEVTKTDKENTRAVFNTLSGFMTPFNSFDSDQDGPQKGNRRHEFNSRDRNLDRPDEESESDERRHHDDRDRDEHGNAFETKESKERNNKLYQTLANAQPKHATTKDPIHSSTQKKNIQKTKTLESGLYNVLANIKEGKMKRRNMTSLSARHAMIRPTEPPTRGTRPARPTRPTPPTRPTRAHKLPL